MQHILNIDGHLWVSFSVIAIVTLNKNGIFHQQILGRTIKTFFIGFTDLGHSKYQKTSKLHHWFKSSGDLAEYMDFSYWWSCIGKGLRAACEAGLFFISMIQVWYIIVRNYLVFSASAPRPIKSISRFVRLYMRLYASEITLPNLTRDGIFLKLHHDLLCWKKNLLGSWRTTLLCIV